jgi:hypothetical protein
LAPSAKIIQKIHWLIGFKAIMKRLKISMLEGIVQVSPPMQFTKLASECGFARKWQSNQPSGSVALLVTTGKQLQTGAF